MAFEAWDWRATGTTDPLLVDAVLGFAPVRLPGSGVDDFWDNVDAAGDDLRFTEADGETEIPFHLIVIDTTSKFGWVMLKVGGSLSASVEVDYVMYWGNVAAAAYAYTDTYGRNAVYSGGGLAAGWTMTGADALLDVTGGGRNLTASGSPSTTSGPYTGLGAYDLNGTSQALQYTGSPLADGWNTSGATLEGYFRSDSATANQTVIGLGRSTTNDLSMMKLRASGAVGADPVQGILAGDSGFQRLAATSTGYSTATWHHGAVSRDANSGTTTVWLDGGSSGTNSVLLNTPTLDRTTVGGFTGSSTAEYFDGRVGWMGVHSTVRGSTWISTWRNAWGNAGFLVWGTPEANGGGGVTPGDTGWQLFQVAASVAFGTQVWTNPTYALVDDANAAIADCAEDEISYYLRFLQPDFSSNPVPTGAVITDVAFRLKRNGESHSARDIRDHTIRPYRSGVIGDNQADTVTQWSTTQTIDYTGLWSVGDWDPADFDANFGFVVAVQNHDLTEAEGRVFAAWCKVTWDAPAADVTGTAEAAADAEAAAEGALGVRGTADAAAEAAVDAAGVVGARGTVDAAADATVDAAGAVGAGGTADAAAVAAVDAAGFLGVVGTAGAAVDAAVAANDGANVTGTAVAAVVAGGTASGAVGEPGPCDGTSLVAYLTGAASDGGAQRDPRLSTGGFRSASRARSLQWDWHEPLPGVEILEVGGGNGRGVGALGSPAENELEWTAPGASAAGASVAVAAGAEAVVPGLDTGQWIRVRRGTAPLRGAASVKCLDVYNDVVGMEDVSHAEAVSGAVAEVALGLRNEAAGWLDDLRFWLGDCDGSIEIAAETPVAGALQAAPAAGLTWSTAETPETGIAYGVLEAGGLVGLRIRRTVAADMAPAGTQLIEVRYSYSDGETTYEGALRGRYRIARTDWRAWGVWVGVDAAPDLAGPPDEVFTSGPHTTSLGLEDGHRYQVVVRRRNQWGLWSQNTEPVVVEVDDTGTVVAGRPQGPSSVTLSQSADNEARVGAVYEVGADPYPGHLFAVWVHGDGTTPDGTGTPSGFARIEHRAAFGDLQFTDTGAAWDDGTPLAALVRVRRLVGTGGDVFAPDMIQLDDSDPGVLKVSSELSGWGSSGRGRITRVDGELLEVFTYSAVVVGTGETTITVDARGLWGTSPVETSAALRVEPVTWVDSENTAVETWTVVAMQPRRVRGEVLLADTAAVYQAGPDGPDGETPVVIDAGENIHLLLGPGWAALYWDTLLVWRVLYDSTAGERNGWYVPDGWTLVESAVSGTPGGSGIWDLSGGVLYLVAGGVRRLAVDPVGMTITALTLDDGVAMPPRTVQAGTLPQYAGSLLLSFDPGAGDYVVVGRLSGAGAFEVLPDLDNTLSQAAVEAL